MKSYLTIFILLFSSVFSISAQTKKVALTSFWVNKHINFEQLGGAAGLAASVATLSESPDFNLQPVLDSFYSVFMNDFAAQFPFELLDEDVVLNDEDYQNYRGRFNESDDKDRGLFLQRFLVPKTYKPLQESLFKTKNSNQMQMVSLFEDRADGVMFVSMGYEFIRKPLPFTAGIRAYCRIKIWNNKGKRVVTVNEYAKSKKSIPIIAGIPVMKPEKLLPMCIDSSNELIEDLHHRMKKITRKAARKL